MYVCMNICARLCVCVCVSCSSRLFYTDTVVAARCLSPYKHYPVRRTSGFPILRLASLRKMFFPILRVASMHTVLSYTESCFYTKGSFLYGEMLLCRRGCPGNFLFFHLDTI